MKRFLLRVLVFIAVAVGTAFLVNKLNNAGLDRVSKELDEPTLPYVYLEFDGKVINRTCGYTADDVNESDAGRNCTIKQQPWSDRAG